MSRVLVWCLAALGAALPALASAYAAFDDIQAAAPVWLASAEPAFPGLTYRVQRGDPDEAALELWNRGTQVLELRVRLGQGFQGDAAFSAPLTLAAGAHGRVPVPRPRLEQGLYRARLRARSAGATAEAGDDGALPPAATVATYVQCAGDDVGFRADALACTVRVLEDGRSAEVHFKNLSHDALHFAFRLAGHQTVSAAANPRMHVLPGATAEVEVPLAAADARAVMALVDVWDVRIGEDQGALRAAHDGGHPRFDEEPGWNPVQAAGEAEGSAAFSPRALLWRNDPAGGGVLLRNACDRPLAFAFHVVDLQPGPAANPGVALAAHATTRVAVALPAHAGRTMALAVSGVLVADQPLPAATTASLPVLPADRFTATARVPDRAFNPRTLAYVAMRGATGMAQVTVANLSAAALHAEFRLAGYQDAGLPNPRLHLAPGEQRVLTLPVLRSDARLALALLQVWDVRVGADEGPLCCALAR